MMSARITSLSDVPKGRWILAGGKRSAATGQPRSPNQPRRGTGTETQNGEPHAKSQPFQNPCASASLRLCVKFACCLQTKKLHLGQLVSNLPDYPRSQNISMWPLMNRTASFRRNAATGSLSYGSVDRGAFACLWNSPKPSESHQVAVGSTFENHFGPQQPSQTTPGKVAASRSHPFLDCSVNGKLKQAGACIKPGGRRKIAQRFIAGFARLSEISPVRDERTSASRAHLALGLGHADFKTCVPCLFINYI